MDIVKLYQKPDNPEFFKLVRCEDNQILVVYPISRPDRARSAMWLDLSKVRVDWVKTFMGD